jgi:hypothetical protein
VCMCKRRKSAVRLVQGSGQERAPDEPPQLPVVRRLLVAGVTDALNLPSNARFNA